MAKGKKDDSGQAGEQQPPETGTGSGEADTSGTNDAGSTDGAAGDGDGSGPKADEPDPASKPDAKGPKAAKGGKAAAPAPPVSQEMALVARFQTAEAAVKLAKDTVTTAEHELTEAGKALGAFLAPPGAKRNEKVVVWIGTGDARECIEIIVGKEGKYTIRPYGTGGPDQVRVPT